MNFLLIVVFVGMFIFSGMSQCFMGCNEHVIVAGPILQIVGALAALVCRGMMDKQKSKWTKFFLLSLAVWVAGLALTFV